MPATTTTALRSQEFPFFIYPLSSPGRSKASQSFKWWTINERASFANARPCCQVFLFSERAGRTHDRMLSERCSCLLEILASGALRAHDKLRLAVDAISQ